MSVELLEGDNRDHLRRLIDEGVRVHAIVTDPPYGLTSVVKRFGKEGSAPARHEKNDGSFTRLSGGFMGQTWDGTGIERDPEFWRLCWEILLPGGYVFAFGGARTGHWLACAMEMAGFIMHPTHGWLYGCGFPKAHNASRAIDKMLGTTAEREVVATRYEGRRFAPGATVVREGGYRKRQPEDGNEQTFQANVERGGCEQSRQWDGWAYGTQAQKPAFEPIFLGQRPFSERTGPANLLKHGVGAVNIDGCRAPMQEGEENPSIARRKGAVGHLKTRPAREAEAEGRMESRTTPERYREERPGERLGRHPANLLHDGSPEVAELFPGGEARFFNALPFACDDCLDTGIDEYGEACLLCGGASLPEMPPVFYNDKARKADRAGSKHPTVKPVALLCHLIRHITPPGGVVLDPFAGSGTTAEAARQEGFPCVLMESHGPYARFLRARFNLPKTWDDEIEEMLG